MLTGWSYLGPRPALHNLPRLPDLVRSLPELALPPSFCSDAPELAIPEDLQDVVPAQAADAKGKGKASDKGACEAGDEAGREAGRADCGCVRERLYTCSLAVGRSPLHALSPYPHACNLQPPCAGKGKVGEASAAAAAAASAFPGDDGLALATMDIFAGCGGLSEGMHQAGEWTCG